MPDSASRPLLMEPIVFSGNFLSGPHQDATENDKIVVNIRRFTKFVTIRSADSGLG